MKPEFQTEKSISGPAGAGAQRLCWEIADPANFHDLRKIAPFQALLGESDARGTTVNLRYDSQRFQENDLGATVIVLGATGFHMSIMESFVPGESGGRVVQLNANFSDHWCAAFAIVESTSAVLVPRHPEQVWENGDVLAGDEQLVQSMWNQLPLFRVWKPEIAPRRNKST